MVQVNILERDNYLGGLSCCLKDRTVMSTSTLVPQKNTYMSVLGFSTLHGMFTSQLERWQLLFLFWYTKQQTTAVSSHPFSSFIRFIFRFSYSRIEKIQAILNTIKSNGAQLKFKTHNIPEILCFKSFTAVILESIVWELVFESN